MIATKDTAAPTKPDRIDYLTMFEDARDLLKLLSDASWAQLESESKGGCSNLRGEGLYALTKTIREKLDEVAKAI